MAVGIRGPSAHRAPPTASPTKPVRALGARPLDRDGDRLERDRNDWHVRLTSEQRRGALWLYAAFFHGPVSRDREAIAIMFDTLARQADARRVPPGTTIAWDFEDAEPWHVVLDPAARPRGPVRPCALPRIMA